MNQQQQARATAAMEFARNMTEAMRLPHAEMLAAVAKANADCRAAGVNPETVGRN